MNIPATTTTATPAPARSNHISQLRDHLLGTLADLRDRKHPMDPQRARAVADVASVLVDTARVEVDYLKVTKQQRSGFLEEPANPANPALPSAHNPFPSGITGVRRHALEDDE